MIINTSRFKMALFLLLMAVLCGTTKMLAQTVKYITPDLLSTTAVYTITEDGTYVLAGGTKTNPKPNADPASVTFAGFIKFTNTVTDATLYLNGFTLRCNAVQHIIQNNGTLIIKGTWPGEGHLNTGGVIAGGNNTFEIEGRAIYNTGKLTIEGITIQNCDSGSKDGAGIRNGNRALTITNCTFNNCVTTGRGGAIYSNKGTVTFNSGTIKNCAALNGKGGGIHIEGGKLIMNGGTIRECYARTGGGVYIGNFMDSGVEKSGDFVLNAGTITQCYAVQDRKTNFKDPDSPDVGINRYVGGGVAVLNSDMTMNGGTVSYCYAGSGAGGVYVMSPSGLGEYKSNFYIYDGAKITYCEGYFFGGASHVGQGSTCIMYGGEVSYNICRSGGKDDAGINYSGGGFEVGSAAGSTFDIRGGKVCHNQALGEKIGDKTGYGYGGGIFMRITESGSGGIINLNGGAEISDNYAKNKGGGVYARSDVTVDNASIINNESGKDGGGIYFENTCAKFSFLSGTISNNISGQNGGALYFDNFGSNVIELIQGTLSNNTATNYGGGVYMVNSRITFGTGSNNVSFANNSAAQGGGLYISSTGTAIRNVTINNSSFIENTASDCGGGIYLDDNGYGTLSLGAGGTFSNNTAANHGGAIYVDDINTVVLTEGTLSENEATSGCGGGMYVGSGNITLSSGSASLNTAYDGGAFYVNAGTLTIEDAYTMSYNVANHDGAGLYAQGGTVDINGGTINENKALSGNGGAFFLGTGAKITLEDGSIEDNKAKNGGAIYLSKGAYFEYITSETGAPGYIRGNSATNLGGGIYLAQGTASNKTEMKFTLHNNTNLGFYDNTAEVGGDDIYAYGNGTTTINIPDVQSMNLGGYSIPGATLEWWEDYKVNDSRYSAGTMQGDASNVTRYRASRDADLPIWKVPKLSSTPLSTFYEKYLCLTLGFEYGKIEIRRAGLKPNENAIYEVKFGDGSQREIQRVIVYGSDEDGIDVDNKHWNMAKVSFLPKGQYTVTEIPWTWYNDYKEESYLSKTQDISVDNGHIFNFENAHHNLTETPLHDEEFIVNILKK